MTENSYLEHFFGDLSQIEEHAEIKPPLVGSSSWEFSDQTVYLLDYLDFREAMEFYLSTVS